MAFDGITIASLVHEFKDTLEGGRISKIAQPEKDELLIAIKNNKENYRLQISASASPAWSASYSSSWSIWMRWAICAAKS